MFKAIDNANIDSWPAYLLGWATIFICSSGVMDSSKKWFWKKSSLPLSVSTAEFLSWRWRSWWSYKEKLMERKRQLPSPMIGFLWRPNDYTDIYFDTGIPLSLLHFESVKLPWHPHYAYKTTEIMIESIDF